MDHGVLGSYPTLACNANRRCAFVESAETLPIIVHIGRAPPPKNELSGVVGAVLARYSLRSVLLL
jgi:hypothetical protein